MATNRVRKIIVLAAFVVALSTISLAGFLFPDLTPVDRLWREHYTLLVPESAESSTVVANLEAAGFDSILAEPTATVSYNAFSGLQTIAVSEVHSRFEPLDPRLDPYMSRLPAYFHTLNGRRPMSIYYLRTDLPPLSVHYRVSEVLDDIVLVEWGFWRAALFLGAFAGYVLILILRSSVDRSAVLFAAVPWIAWIIVGSASTFIAACLSLFLFVIWIEELVPFARAAFSGTRLPLRRFVVRTVFAALGVTGTLVALIVSRRDGVAALLIAGTGSVVVAGIVVYLHWLRQAESEHRPFTPVDILTPTLWDSLRGRHPSPVLSVAPFVVIPLLVLAFLPQTHSPFVPEPRPVAGAEAFDPHSMRILWTHEEQNSLPDLADYIAHRAYQEGFLYGATYSFPSDTLAIPRFRYEDDRMVRWEEPVAVYDKDWFADVVSTTADPSVSRLLTMQDTAVSVVFVPVSVIFARGVTVPSLLIVVLLVFAPFVVSFTPAVSLDLLRGKRQEA